MVTTAHLIENCKLKNLPKVRSYKRIASIVSKAIGPSVIVRPEGMDESDLETLGCYLTFIFDGVEYEADCSHAVTSMTMRDAVEMSSGHGMEAMTFMMGECLSTDREIVREVKRRVTDKLLEALIEAAIR